MNRIFTKFICFFVLLCLGVGHTFSQTFCLQMTEVSNDGTNLVLDVFMSGDVSFELGSANLQFAGAPGAFGSAELVSSPLAPPVYFIPTITQPLPGSYSINIELAFPLTGITIDPTNTLLAQISLPILDANLAADGFSWAYTGSTTQTVAFLDDEATQIFATTPLCLLGYTVDESNVRLLAVNQDLKQITFKNFGLGEQDISDWRLCSNLNYTFSGMEGDANITIIAGDYLLSEGEEMTVAWTPTSGFRESGDDIGIYLPSGAFTSPEAMVDFMQYLSAGNGRESVAVAKGIWGTGDFVSDGSPYDFIGTGEDTGVVFWSGVTTLDGCTDITACNYNDDPNVVEDGSCIFASECEFCSGETDGTGTVVSVNPCPTDFNGDGTTNGSDFTIFLGNFGITCTDICPCPTDLDGNEVTNGLDFTIFLGNFGIDCN